MHRSPITVPDDVRTVHDELIAKCKLNAMFRSHAVKDKPIKVGDIIQIYIKKDNQERGSWSLPKTVLKYDRASHTVTVPGAKGHYVEAAIEDVRHAVSQHSLIQLIQDAIDVCDYSIEDATRDLDDTIEDSAEQNKEFAQPRGQCDFGNTGSKNQEPIENEPQLTCIPAQTTDTLSQENPHAMNLRSGNSYVYSSEIELIPGTTRKSCEREDSLLYENRLRKNLCSMKRKVFQLQLLQMRMMLKKNALSRRALKYTVQKCHNLQMS